MKNLHIIHTYDGYSCDHDGCSGGSAYGVTVMLDGEEILKLIPRAHCWDSITYNERDILMAIFKAMCINFSLEEDADLDDLPLALTSIFQALNLDIKVTEEFNY
jgi:hypothetical protein